MVNILPRTDNDGDGDILVDLSGMLPGWMVLDCIKLNRVEIICVEEALPKSFENELVEDMLSLLSVFTAKLHGKRSSKNRKKNESLS